IAPTAAASSGRITAKKAGFRSVGPVLRALRLGVRRLGFYDPSRTGRTKMHPPGHTGWLAVILGRQARPKPPLLTERDNPMLGLFHLFPAAPANRRPEKQRARHEAALWLATLLAVLALIGIAYAAPLASGLRDGHFRVGVLVSVDASTTPSMAAFVNELQKLGYVEDQNTVIDLRS